MIYDEEQDKHVQSGALKQKQAAEARRARQEAAFLREERAKKAKFDNLTTLKGLNKEEFRTMRAQNFYDMPNNSTDGHFWRKEQELIMKEIYANLDPKALVCPQKPLNFDVLAKKTYFADALWVARKIGLEPLITTQQDYDIDMVQQFFATLVLGDEEDTKMTWMTGPLKVSAHYSEFGEALGYVFKYVNEPVGHRMHVEGVAYDKKILAPLAARGGALATTKGLKPIYNILIRMFRWSIAPQAGNTDAIRGALVNLMYHCHKTFLAGPNCQGFEIDVMDFIKCEINIAIHERKNPMYAPYVMKLILKKIPNLNQFRFKKHTYGTLQVLRHHLTQATYEEIEEQEAPRARRKNATPPSWDQGGKQRVNEELKKVSWWQRAMMCMGVGLHKENHQTYVTNKRILSNQAKMMKEMRKISNGGTTPPRNEDDPETPPSASTISLDKWNEDTFHWSDYAEVTSMPSSSRNTGKDPCLLYTSDAADE